MTVNERIKAALGALGLPVVPDVYKGDAKAYFVFHYDLTPFRFSDNRPAWYKALIQVHLILPLGVNSIPLRNRTIRALAGRGFAWPEVIDATDGGGQDFVFETEILINLEE